MPQLTYSRPFSESSPRVKVRPTTFWPVVLSPGAISRRALSLSRLGDEKGRMAPPRGQPVFPDYGATLPGTTRDRELFPSFQPVPGSAIASLAKLQVCPPVQAGDSTRVLEVAPFFADLSRGAMLVCYFEGERSSGVLQHQRPLNQSRCAVEAGSVFAPPFQEHRSYPAPALASDSILHIYQRNIFLSFSC